LNKEVDISRALLNLNPGNTYRMLWFLFGEIMFECIPGTNQY